MIADHIGREMEVEALGQKWTFSRWDRSVWAQLAEWAKGILPDPLEAVSRNLDKIALKDGEILRELLIKDNAELERAKTENRAPVLLKDNFKPFADVLVEKALDKASSYLSFNSPELNSLLRSAAGTAHLFYLLLKPKHPDVTEDQAYSLVTELDSATINKIFETVSGKSRAKNDGSRAAG